MDKTRTNYLTSNVCLELLKVNVHLNMDKTRTNYLTSNVCLELLKVNVHLNLDKTRTNHLALCLESLKNWYFT